MTGSFNCTVAYACITQSPTGGSATSGPATGGSVSGGGGNNVTSHAPPLQSSDAVSLYNLGNALLNQGNYADAI